MTGINLRTKPNRSSCEGLSATMMRLCCIALAPIIFLHLWPGVASGQSERDVPAASVGTHLRASLVPGLGESDSRLGVAPLTAEVMRASTSLSSALGSWFGGMGLQATFQLSRARNAGGFDLGASLAFYHAGGVASQPAPTAGLPGAESRLALPSLLPLTWQLEQGKERQRSVSSLMSEAITSLRGATSTRLDLDEGTQLFFGVGKAHDFGLLLSLTHHWPLFSASN